MTILILLWVFEAKPFMLRAAEFPTKASCQEAGEYWKKLASSMEGQRGFWCLKVPSKKEALEP